MKKCKHCGVDIVADKSYCPLCYNDVEVDNKENSPSLLVERTTNEKYNRKGEFIAKIFLLISIVVVAVCFYVNFTTNINYLWSILVFFSILYVWILVAHTIISKRSVFEKITFQLLGVIAILFTAYLLSPNSGGNWMVMYVLPAVTMFATVTMVFISFINKNRGKYLLSFVAVYVAFIILSLTLVLTLDTFKTINTINILVNSLAFVGSVLLGHKWINKEFRKNFHL